MGTFWRHTWDLLLKGGLMIAGFFQGMMSGDNYGIVLLLVLMIADYLSGVVSALLKKSPKTQRGGLDSEIGARGLLKKGLMLLVVVVAYALDRFVGQGNAMFQSAVTWFYISNEALSLVENLALCGVPVPRKLTLALERLAAEKEADFALDPEAIEQALAEEVPNPAQAVEASPPQDIASNETSEGDGSNG